MNVSNVVISKVKPLDKFPGETKAAEYEKNAATLESTVVTLKAEIGHIKNQGMQLINNFLTPSHRENNAAEFNLLGDVIVKVNNESDKTVKALGSISPGTAPDQPLRLKNNILKPVSSSVFKKVIHWSEYSKQIKAAKEAFSTDGSAVTKRSLENRLSFKDEILNFCESKGTEIASLDRQLNKASAELSHFKTSAETMRTDAHNFMIGKITEGLETPAAKNILSRNRADSKSPVSKEELNKIAEELCLDLRYVSNSDDKYQAKQRLVDDRMKERKLPDYFDNLVEKELDEELSFVNNIVKANNVDYLSILNTEPSDKNQAVVNN